MSSTASISSILSQNSGASSNTKTAGDTIGKEDFLKLLVTQLQKQDPLNPQDPTEFTSQLTQFSSLEQLVNANKKLETMNSSQSFNSMLQASSFIGRTARVAGDEFKLESGGTAPLRYNLPRDAEKVNLNITDSTGKLIRTIEVGKASAGNHDYAWDGKLASGLPAGAGSYAFEFTATDADGNAITTTPMVEGAVSSVSFENGEPMLEVGGFAWPLSNVISLK